MNQTQKELARMFAEQEMFPRLLADFRASKRVFIEEPAGPRPDDLDKLPLYKRRAENGTRFTVDAETLQQITEAAGISDLTIKPGPVTCNMITVARACWDMTDRAIENPGPWVEQALEYRDSKTSHHHFMVVETFIQAIDRAMRGWRIPEWTPTSPQVTLGQYLLTRVYQGLVKEAEEAAGQEHPGAAFQKITADYGITEDQIMWTV